MPVERALAQPRFHHQWRPDELKIERKIGNEVLDELRRRGHHVVAVDSLGAAQGMSFDGKSKEFSGSADPRLSGKAGGL